MQDAYGTESLPCSKNAESVRCYVRGNGYPVIFIQGLGGSRRFWDRHAEWFSQTYRVVTLDYPDGAPGDFVTSTAAALAAALDDLGITRAVVIGHSLGGLVAQTLALDYPHLVVGLVLSATLGSSEGYAARLMRTRRDLLELGGLDTYRAISDVLRYTSPDDRLKFNNNLKKKTDGERVAGLTAKMDSAIQFDRLDGLSSLRTPTLVICAKDDLVTPVEYSRMLASCIPGATLCELPNGGHYAPLSRHDDYQTILRNGIAEMLGNQDRPALTTRLEPSDR